MNALPGKISFFCRLLLALALLAPCAGRLFAQEFSLSAFELEAKALENEDGCLSLAGTLEAGGVISFGSHFNLSAGIELSSSNILSLFSINEADRSSASIKITSLAIEFPFSNGWELAPVVFWGEHADIASGGLLSRMLKVKISAPDFLRYGALSAFSCEAETEGLGAGIAWCPRKLPVALAAYGAWDGVLTEPGFNVYAQAAGNARGLLWNAFAVFGRGEEDSEAGLSADDFYISGGFSARAEGQGNLSIYMQAEILPFRIGYSGFSLENIKSRFHFLFEPSYRGRLFEASAAFFLSPVMQEKNVPYLDLEEDVLYVGTNIMLALGGAGWGGKSFGFNFALFADTNSASSGWDDILRICVSPFFKWQGDIFAFTASAFFNLSKIATPLSAGEINIHIEAAL